MYVSFSLYVTDKTVHVRNENQLVNFRVDGAYELPLALNS